MKWFVIPAEPRFFLYQNKRNIIIMIMDMRIKAYFELAYYFQLYGDED